MRGREGSRELNDISGGFGLPSLREPISLPQRRRLLGAAKRVERIGSDAGAILGRGVAPSKNLVVYSEGGFVKSERFGRLARHKEQESQIAARVIAVWMLRAERLFAYRQRRRVERPRAREAKLRVEGPWLTQRRPLVRFCMVGVVGSPWEREATQRASLESSQGCIRRAPA